MKPTTTDTTLPRSASPAASGLRALLRREWLQHRFGWALMAGLPLLLSLVLLSFGQINIGDDSDIAGPALPAILALGALAASIGVLFAVAAIGSLAIVSGLGRRDHADRSVEFWLSLPISHPAAFAVPLLVHLLLVPAAAMLIGLLGGIAVSLVLVARVSGIEAWLGLPWGQIATAALALLGRLLVGLPMALLWLSPLVLAVVVLTAWFKRWAWVILTAGLTLGGYLLKTLFGQPFLAEVTAALLQHAARALVAMDGPGLHVDSAADALAITRLIPSWAWDDGLRAAGDLASPLLLGALLFAAACFALLVQWRQRGAGGAG